MSLLSNLGGLSPAAALVGGGTLLILLLWLGWRKPTWLFLIALASLAIRPQLLWGGPRIGYEWGLDQTLIVFALAMSALRYGVRRTINWPILALVTTFGLSLAFGNLNPKLTLAFMLMSLAYLALPFAFTQVVLEPGSRRACALAIALAPLLSVALGAVLQLLGIWEVFSYGRWGGDWYRLQGAIGDAATFAALAFAGFVVAVHEATRPARPYAIPLAVINMILVIFSGTRMAIFASLCFVGVYGMLSKDLRELCRQQRRAVLSGAGAVFICVAAYLPTLRSRTFNAGFSSVQMSGREDAWPFFLQEWLFSPVFGRGFGAGFLDTGLAHWGALPPYNEYLHLLVIGGVAGFALIVGALALWFRDLYKVASPNDRRFLLALLPAFGAYALTDCMLSHFTILALYAYLGVQLTRPRISGFLPSMAPGPCAERRDSLRMPAVVGAAPRPLSAGDGD